MLYRKNVGSVERWVRVAAGMGLAAWGLARFGVTPLGLLMAASGAGFALTGLFGFCPACALAGRKPADRP